MPDIRSDGEPVPGYRYRNHLDETATAAKEHRERGIRAALAEKGIDPDAVEEVARRAAAGEFDMDVEVRITE